MISVISSLPLPHKYIWIKSSYPFHQKTLSLRHSCSWNHPCPISDLFRHKHLSDSKSYRGAEMKSKIFPCWLPAGQRYNRYNRTFLYRGFCTVSVDEVDVGGTSCPHDVPRGATGCFVWGWKDALRFQSWVAKGSPLRRWTPSWHWCHDDFFCLFFLYTFIYSQYS